MSPWRGRSPSLCLGETLDSLSFQLHTHLTESLWLTLAHLFWCLQSNILTDLIRIWQGVSTLNPRFTRIPGTSITTDITHWGWDRAAGSMPSSLGVLISARVEKYGFRLSWPVSINHHNEKEEMIYKKREIKILWQDHKPYMSFGCLELSGDTSRNPVCLGNWKILAITKNGFVFLRYPDFPQNQELMTTPGKYNRCEFPGLLLIKELLIYLFAPSSAPVFL